ncbi:MAG TPA: hypothetical protein VMC02_01825 [Steroidobacteraceae bacterium]|nr:hypothetical protein [Steroidobacteraceae bacterium]
MKTLPVLLAAAIALPHAVRAADADAIRGGWVAEVTGRTQVYMLIVRGDAVTGTQCFDCADPANLGFIHGRLDAQGVQFTLRHEDRAGKVTVDDAQGRLNGKELVLTLQPHGRPAHPTTLTLHRPPPLPPVRILTNDEAELPGLAPGKRPAYVLPGAPERWSPGKVPGLWLWGTGPGKQYFIIRRVDGQLLGMVCGPCDNPNAMAPLDGFEIDGADLRFNIVHEDTGAAVQHGPFNNVAHATLARNEMHIKVIPSFDPNSKPIEMTLLGPVAFQPPD